MKAPSLLRQVGKRVLPEHLHPVMFGLRKKWLQSLERQKQLGEFATAILTETKHGRLLVPAGDMEVGRYLAHGGNYGLAEIEFHLRYLTMESRILVVGTHVGALLVPLAKRVRRVVGIEANPDTFRLLEMNVSLNGLSNVQLYNIAAGNRNGEVDFLMHRCNTGASAIVSGDLAEGKPWARFDEPKIQRLPIRKLDEVIMEPAFDLIIMDVEGAEFDAMQGMERILASSQRLQIEIIPSLVRARSQATAEEFIQLLAKNFATAQLLGQEQEMAIQPTATILGKILQGSEGHDLFLEKSPRRR